ncbi:phage portal protein [Lactococcus nasutitermitis]|uniref:Phage portal protein n=1 Tax=Lactococcus nasutitermitis TaxID=1652957 RepID=A0ABV9JFB8_9LACT|nr:phage portal protein [Lactococcus nasutitermitis]
MGLFSEIWENVKTKLTSQDNTGYAPLFSAQVNLGLKNAALEACENYLARLVSKGTFIFKQNGIVCENSFDYALNIRPNPNQTASEFKIALVKKLLNGEVLVIKDGIHFYVADNFVTNYSLSGNIYTGVTVDFSSDTVSGSGVYPQKYITTIFEQGVNCFYLKNDNEGLEKYVDGLWKDYGRLFGILITNQLRVGQLRAKVDFPINTKIDADEAKQQQKEFVDKTFNKLLNDPVVLIPNGGASRSTYDEVPAGKSDSLQNQITDFGALKKLYIGEIAQLLGLPPALVLGEVASNSENLDLAIEAAVKPIANKLCEALTYLLLKDSGFQAHKTIEMSGFNTVDILDRAEAIDKAGASGILTINEVREAAGKAPIKDGNKFIMTKNYQEKGEDSEKT